MSRLWKTAYSCFLRAYSKNNLYCSNWYKLSNIVQLHQTQSTGCLLRSLHLSSSLCCEGAANQHEITEEGNDAEPDAEEVQEDEVLPDGGRIKVIAVDPQTSIDYMNSKSYEMTYRGEPVWVPYRRNYPGQYLPQRTRRKCISKGVLITGNPCPICRDEYLVVHETNVDLLKQFIDPNTGEVLPCNKVQVCQREYKKILTEVQKAFDKGHLQMRVPFRKYNYSDYYPQLKVQQT